MFISVDVEADGPIPGDYSMIAIGATFCTRKFESGYHARIRAMTPNFVPEALAVTGFSREMTLSEVFKDPAWVMRDFAQWISSVCVRHGVQDRLYFIADNNGFDWQFVNWYFHHFKVDNPFGYSSINLGSLWKGMQKNMKANFKHMRKTKHDHNPLNDAKGNAEAFLEMQENHGLVVP